MDQLDQNTNSLNGNSESASGAFEAAALILVKLAELNIKVKLKNGNLHLNAPHGVLGKELLKELKDNKASIVKYLENSNDSQLETNWPSITPDTENKFLPFPLSEVQHAYWIGRSKGIEFGNVATHYYYELASDSVDLEKFNAALVKLIERHDMMRAIVMEGGQQKIMEQVPAYVVRTYDFRHESDVVKKTRMLALRAEMSAQLLPADTWPLFDIRAVRLSDTKTQLYFSWDFINLDAWSVYAICREWNVLYDDIDAVLPPIEMSYRDYILAELELRESEVYKRDKEYWWNRLDSIPEAPILPVKSNTNPNHRHTFTRRRFALDGQKWQQLKTQGAKLGITPSNILLAAYAEVLAIWSKEKHFTLNMTFFNRLPLHKDVYSIVGDFTSLTLLEIDARSPTTLANRAKSIQSQFMQDFEHRMVSGVEVMREWAKRRNLSLQASMPVVFTSCLVLNSAEGDDSSLVESFGDLTYGISQTPQVWLDNQIMEDKDGLVFNWDAVEEVFAPGVLDEMFEAYCNLILRLAETPEYWNNKLPVAIPQAQVDLITQNNATANEVPTTLLHEGFVNRAQSQPNAIAVRTNNIEWSYAELLQRSLVLAEEIVRLGAADDSNLVGIVAEKGPFQIVAVFAVLLAGKAYMPIDPDLPKARIELLFQQSQSTLAIIDRSARLSQLPEHITPIQIDEDHNSSSSLNATLHQTQSELAYVIFTSGSTGVPKGVMIDHLGAVNTLQHINRLFNVESSDSVLGVSSLSFDLSVYDIFGVLAAGGCLVLPDADKSSAPEHWLELIQKYNITLWNSAPPLLTMLTNYMEGFECKPNYSIRLTLLSGDWIPLDTKDKLNKHLCMSKLISLGGATEASVWSIYHPVKSVEASWKSIPYGKALPNQTMYVLDDNLQHRPLHTVGKIYIGGIGLAKGYLNDSEKTDRHFITSEFGRLYYTGDLGRYMGDGEIEFLGREDDQVKLRGHRIELGEITSVLRGHEAVENAVAVINGDSRQDQSLWAFLQIDQDKMADISLPVNASSDAMEYSPIAIRQRISQLEERSPSTPLSEEHIRMWQGLDELYFESLINLFATNNTFQAGKAYTLQELQTELLLAPRYQRWLSRALRFLAERGILAENNECYSLVGEWPVSHLQEKAGQCESQLVEIQGLTDHESKWFTMGALKLLDILQEKIHSAELYTATETAIIYQKLFPESHIQLVNTIDCMLSGTERSLRVFEVGAGLGSATQHILPRLKNRCESYVFTDLSPYFLRRAKDLFSEFDFVDYDIFNLDHSPEQQGFETASYDLVIASSVLHDVSDIRRTLAHIKSLLAPGGIVVLLEETKFLKGYDLTMGLQQGFDVFTDLDIRQSHCLVSADKWKSIMIEEGFQSSEAMTVSGTVSEYVGFDVIVGQMPDKIDILDEDKLNRHILSHLPSYMKPNGYHVLREFPLTANGKIDYQQLTSAKASRKASGSQFQAKGETEVALHKIWADVLEKADFGVKSSFFEIGGDSLLLVEVRNKIKKELGKQVATTTLFEFPTIAELAKHLDSDTKAEQKDDETKNRARKQQEALRRRRASTKGVEQNV